MGFGITGTVDIKPLQLVLDRLKRGSKNRILRKGVTKGSNIVNKAAKAKVKAVRVGSNVSDRSAIMSRMGLLHKSLGTKVTSYPKAVVGVIGPRRGFKAQIGVTKIKGRKTGNPPGTPIFEDPGNLGHLIEFGHGGPHPAPPHPFMRPAWDESRSAVVSAIADSVAHEIAQLATG